MKTKKYIAILVFAAFAGWSCTNLDERTYTELPREAFQNNEQLLTLYSGSAYRALQEYCTEQSLWTLNVQVGDECAVPRNAAGSWTESRYEELQKHNFVVSNKLINKGWTFCYNGIAICNEVIETTENSPFDFDGKHRILAELKVLRAFFYFCAIDGWGNVAFTIDASDKSYPEQKDRAFMFPWIEKEITDNIYKLDEVPSSINYGRITRGTANAILAKMYLNAEEWIGTAKWAEAETACLDIINSGHYSIEDNYKKNFEVGNEGSAENIFSIPYGTAYTKTDHNAFIIYMLVLDPNNAKTFNIPATPWNGFICQPDFFQTYDTVDTRRSDTWLYGQQYDVNGKAMKIGDDDFIINPVFTDDKYSSGRGEMDGAKLWKWSYQTDGLLTGGQVSMDNHFALFRYADVLYMYVEALLRQSKSVAAATDMDDFKKIRTRAGLAPYTAVDLDLETLFTERGCELAWEGWRRQDLIRFGKFNQAWWAKDASPAYTKLYPIPYEARSANPKLEQNDGYPQ